MRLDESLDDDAVGEVVDRPGIDTEIVGGFGAGDLEDVERISGSASSTR